MLSFPGRRLSLTSLLIVLALLFLSVLFLYLKMETIPFSRDAADLPSIHIPFTSSPLTIDAKLDDGPWAQAAVLELSDYQKNQSLPIEKTTVYLLYDSTYFYVAYKSWDSDIRTMERPLDDVHVHLDDCVELFLGPPQRKIFESVGLEINARGDRLDYRLRPDDFIAINWTLRQLKLAVQRYDGKKTQNGFTGYIVELAIPWKELGRRLKFQGVPPRLKGNFARYNYGAQGRNLTVWSEPQSLFNTPANVDRYGWLHFDKPSGTATAPAH